MHDDLRADRTRQIRAPGDVHVRPDIVGVDSPEARGVQIEEHLELGDQLLGQTIRVDARLVPIDSTRKGAVQIALVGQAPLVSQEARHVDDGGAHHRAANRLGIHRPQEPVDHANAVEFVAVHGGGDADDRSGRVTFDHDHRQPLRSRHPVFDQAQRQAMASGWELVEPQLLHALDRPGLERLDPVHAHSSLTLRWAPRARARARAAAKACRRSPSSGGAAPAAR